MEKDFRDIGFEDFLRVQTDRHKVTPSEEVWLSIHQKLHPKSRWTRLLAGMALFGLGLATGLLLEDEIPNPMYPERMAVPSKTVESRMESIPTADRKVTKPGSRPTKDLASRLQKSSGPSEGSGVMPSQVYMTGVHGDDDGGMELPADPSHSILVTEEADRSMEKPPARPVSPFHAPGKVSLDGYQSSEEGKRNLNPAANPVPTAQRPVSARSRRTAIQLYFSPSISYRRLVGEATQSNYVYNGLPYSANLGFPSDVNKAVTHKPSVGMELGAAFAYPLTRNLRFKAGLQFNLNNYDIEAYSYTPEIAPLTAAVVPGYSRPVNTVSYYRNFFGYSRTWLRNSHFMVSTPVGLELTVPAGRRVSVNLASTLQPTYTLRNNSYLISTNLKNYAQEPSLYRNWNVNAGAEAYVSVSKGSYRWIMGPQIRYQILSSYKDNYPISEHLIDYGMKFGIQKTLK